MYRSYTRDAIDFLKALSVGEAEAQQMFEIEPERVAALQALHAEGRGIILVTGHYGNWEAGAVMMTRFLRLPLTVVAMREANPEVNRIRQRIRDLIGVETLEVRQSLDTPLQIRRALSQNRFVALLVDRHFGRDRVAVTFLGRQAWFLRTPMVMASLTGAPLVPCFIRRIGRGRFAALPGRPVLVRSDLPRDDAIQARRAGGRGPACRAGPGTSRMLVPLLSVLGRPARRVRRPRVRDSGLVISRLLEKLQSNQEQTGEQEQGRLFGFCFLSFLFFFFVSRSPVLLFELWSDSSD